MRPEVFDMAGVAASRVHSGGAGTALRIVSGVFQRLPRAFQENPLLWVEDQSLAGREAEEVRVEQITVRHNAVSAHGPGTTRGVRAVREDVIREAGE